MRADWNYPTAIRFGVGRVSELPEACQELNVQRPLLVTDPGLTGLAEPILDRCRRAGLKPSVFAEVQPNPNQDTVSAGLHHYREAECDGVIAFGGGSALDAGKSVALMVGQDRPLWDFEDRDRNHERVKVAGMAPVVAIPTTSGTGSEVGRVSIITDTATHTKRFLFHPGMLPARVIADPGLTVGLPAGLTAATGMDALSHNLEALCSPTYHPMADGIALEGVRLVDRYLRRAYQDGADLSARCGMMAAALMGATAFQKGLGAIHSLSHPIGGLYGTHHGLTNAVVMPYVLVYNRAATEETIDRLARHLSLSEPNFNGFLQWVLELRSELGVPHTLKELGVQEDDLEELCRQATADPSAGTNPVPLDHAAHRQLFRDALEGRLSSC